MTEDVPDRPTLPDGVAAQHSHLAALIAGMRVRLGQDAPWDELAQSFDRLLADVAAHFADEERLMNEKGYPGVGEHRVEHAEFKKKLGALRLECDRQKTELLAVLIEMLANWLQHHEETADRKAAEFLGAAE
jgi:hemerythrin-like metal-binding protein